MTLLEKCLLDHQDVHGYTALHMAAQVGTQPLVQEILNWHPNLKLQSHSLNKAALHVTLFNFESYHDRNVTLFNFQSTTMENATS